MNSRELKLRRERDEAMDKLRAVNKQLELLERKSKRQDESLTHYMNVNSDLWLQLSKLPGGLEHARRINVAHR